MVVVLEVEAHARELNLDLHAGGLEDIRRSDTASLQHLGSVHRPRRDDNLAPSLDQHRPVLEHLPVPRRDMHARGAVRPIFIARSLLQDNLGDAVGREQVEVRALVGPVVEVAAARVAPGPVGGVDGVGAPDQARGVAVAVLLGELDALDGAPGVPDSHGAGPLERREARMHGRVAAPGVQVVRHAVLLLHPLVGRVEGHALAEERVDVVPPPLARVLVLVVRTSGPYPRVVVLGRAAVEEHAVDGGAAAYDGAAGDGIAPVVSVYEGLGGDVVHAGGGGVLGLEGLAGVGTGGGDVVGAIEIAILHDKDRV